MRRPASLVEEVLNEILVLESSQLRLLQDIIPNYINALFSNLTRDFLEEVSYEMLVLEP